MDTRSIKTGIAVLCGVLLLTFGTGFASAANEEPDNAPKAIYTQESFSWRYLLTYRRNIEMPWLLSIRKKRVLTQQTALDFARQTR